MKTQHPVRGMRKQRGLVVVIVTIALFAFIGIAALAIDINHALMNRTKLQNSVDAATLAAALVLDKSGTKDEATDTAEDALTKMSEATGNGELDFDSADVSIEFSNDPSAFSGIYDDTAEDRYVRVSVADLALDSFFIQILGINKTLSASAVAGPSASSQNICNVVPMGICALDPDAEVGGYGDNDVYAVKMVSNESDMGPGNFQLLDLDGADDDDSSKKEEHIRYQLAGTYSACINLNNTVTTKPGNTIGPTAQGLNTRFGDAINGTDKKTNIYNSDTDVTEATVSNDDVNQSASNLDYSHDDYTGNGRRVLAVPILDCSEANSGKSDFPVVAIGCYFLLQKVAKGNANKSPVYGEFLYDCTATNSTNDGTSTADGPHRVVLYDDPDNKES